LKITRTEKASSKKISKFETFLELVFLHFEAFQMYIVFANAALSAVYENGYGNVSVTFL